MRVKKKCTSNPRQLPTSSTAKRRSYIYPPGTLVEVQPNKLGFRGAWYEATITKTPSPDNRFYRITYKNLVTGRISRIPLQESVYGCRIRPRPPCINDCNDNVVFRIYEQVEAFHNDGWWPGVVNRLPTSGGENGGKYAVYFPSSREEYLFNGVDLRKKLEWVKGDWDSVHDLIDYSKHQEGIHVIYSEGTRVEVSRDRNNYGAAWFVGTVKKVTGRTNFLVEYENLLMDNDNDRLEAPPIIEIVDLQYLRPCPPVLESSAISFNVLDEVEVFVEGAWFLGVISKIFQKSRYMVKYKYKDEETLVLNSTFIRPCHVWTDEHWVLVSRDNRKNVTDGSASTTKKGKKAMRLIDLDRKSQMTQSSKKLKKGTSQGHSANTNSCIQYSRSCKESPLLDSAICLEDNLTPPRRNTTADDRGEETQTHALPVAKDLFTNHTVLDPRELSSDHVAVVGNSFADDRGEETEIHTPPVRKDLVDDIGEEIETHTLPIMKDLDFLRLHNAVNPCELSSNNVVVAGNFIADDRGEETETHTLPKKGLVNGQNVLNPCELSSNSLVVEGKSIADDRGEETQTCTPLFMKESLNGHSVLNPCELSSNTVVKKQKTQIGPILSRSSLSNRDIHVCRENVTSNNYRDDATTLIDPPPMILFSNTIPSPLTQNPAVILRELADSASEVLRIFPQQPHFHPLLQYNKELRSGLECGLIMAFASLVRSIKDLRIVNSEQDFEEKLKTLDQLETYGFNIKRVRDRVEKLLEARRILSQFDRKLEEIMGLEEEKGRESLSLSEIDVRVAELEQTIAQLKEKRTSILAETKKHESKIAELKEVAGADEEKKANAILHFNALLTASW